MYNDSERFMPNDKPNDKPMTKMTAIQLAAQALGRRGGSADTAAQRRARRQNALLAGRPGRTCKTCGKLVQAPTLAEHDPAVLWTWEPARPKAAKKSHARD